MSLSTTALPKIQDHLSHKAAPPSPQTPPFSFILQRLAVKVGLPLLAGVLIVWNALLVALTITLMPQNEFGRTFLSAVAFVHGQDMYAANASTPWWIGDTQLSLWNLNPPHFHVLLLPLAWLPNEAALIVWLIFNVFCFYAALKVIVAEVPLQWTPMRRLWAGVGLLAFVGTGTALVTAHLSFLLFLLLTLAWRDARRGYWVRSAVPFALALSLKPFLLLVVPYYLWRRQGRAVVVLCAVVAACYLAGLLIFGVANNRSWLERLAVADSWAWLPMNASLLGLLTRSFSPNAWCTHFGPLSPATIKAIWLALAVPLGILSLLAVLPDSSPRGIDRAFALLVVGSLLLSPLGWTYYFHLPLGPMLVLGVDWQHERSAAGQRRWTWRQTLLAASIPGFCAPFFALDLGQPFALATVIFGSIYCWSLLLLLTALALDSWLHWRSSTARATPLHPLVPADYRISVVLPVFSETDTVRIVIDWLRTNLDTRLHEILIVISPRSSKESYAVCEEMTRLDPRVQLLVQQVNPGVGNAFREGYARTTGNVILSMDSDNEMELAAIPKMIQTMAANNYAVVVGSRWLPGGGFVGYQRFKRVLNWSFQQLFRVLFLTRCTDLTYGFKLLRAEVVHGIAWEATLHEIGCETTMKPLHAGFAVGEVPSVWTARTQGRSSNNFWRNFRYVNMALRILWHGVAVSGSPRATQAPRA